MSNTRSFQTVLFLAALWASPSVTFADCPVTTNAVTFLGTDTTTQGAWKGAGNFNAPPASSTLTYGRDGDYLPDTEGCDGACNPFPSYVSFGPTCISSSTPGNTGSKPNSTHAYVNLVQGPAGVMGPEPQNTTNTSYFQCNYSDNNPAVPWAPMVAWRPVVDTREISRWYTCSGISSFYLELSFGNSTHNFEVYVVDDMNGGTLARTEELQVLDGNTNAVLWDSGVFTNFSGGVYYKWAITGHVKINVINKATNGRDAVINGVFYDPPNAAPLPVSISIWPANSSVAAGFSEQMIASVTNTSNTGVTWSISSGVGSISASGLYTAPANVTTVQNVVLTATSVADPTKASSATVTLLPPISSVSGGPLVTSMVFGTLRNNYSGWVGFGFKVGSTPMTVSGLGRIAVAGNTQTHTVKLVDGSTGADLPGGSVFVMPGSATPGTFAYAALGSPIVLSAAKTYYVLSQETSGGDQWYENTTTLQTTADAADAGPIYGTGSWTSGGPAGHAYVPVDVKYALGASAPPPPGPLSGTALVTGMAVGTLRNNYSGWVGSAVKVGAAPIVVSGIGRIAVAGNTQSHTVKLVDASTGMDVPNGSATVTPATATPGTMAYAALPAAVTLNANHTYYLMTQESLGGDQWYDLNTTVQTASVATVTSAVYGAAAPYVPIGGSAQSYGPVDLLFSASSSSGVPVITQQPQSATVTSGQSATFSVAASSAATLTYQWQSQPAGTAGFTNIAGATSSTYTTPATASSDNGTQFQCNVTNSSGSVTTSIASLTVQPAGVNTGTPFVTSEVLGALRNNYSGWVGMSITVSGNPLSITALGRIFAPGNTGTHMLKIVNAATGADVLGGSASVTMAGTIGQFVYANLASAVVLNANTTYYVLSQETMGGDQWYDYNTTAATASVAALNGAVYGAGAPYVFLTGSAGRMYVPVNFQYTATVPAPATGTSYVTSELLGTPRNNFTGWIGMVITVGSSPMTVSSLGRMVVSGNTASHVLKLVSAGGADIAGGSLTVSTAGATPGTFVYAQLASPVQLNANTTYYVVSQEAAGGDFWYDWNTTEQTTSTATITGSVWALSNSYATVAGSAGHSYGPLDLKYTVGAPAPGAASYVVSAKLGTLRNNVTGSVGMAIALGSSPMTVSSLGRMVVSGNTANHVLKLVNADGTDVAGGSATVATAGATPGTFIYAQLASPVQLNPSTTYYVVSQETAGGDFWYDWDTTVQTTSAATITGSVWAASNGYSTVPGSAGHSYVPLDLKFQ
ncbi:MAG TPA: immunoglobulin domain-containing protein [Bryobacteraceae bacterium]|nr:immunoglobulin domain-containing protein [Bryobacteraceae bacterium]